MRGERGVRLAVDAAVRQHVGADSGKGGGSREIAGIGDGGHGGSALPSGAAGPGDPGNRQPDSRLAGSGPSSTWRSAPGRAEPGGPVWRGPHHGSRGAAIHGGHGPGCRPPWRWHVLDGPVRGFALDDAGADAFSRREGHLAIFDLRAALEPGLAAMAARRAAPGHLVEMRAALAAQRASVARGESGIREEAAFHRLIAASTGSPRLINLMRSLMPLGRDTRHPALWTAHRATRSLRQHEGILAAIEARNPSLAMRRILVHIRSVERALLAARGRPQPHADAPLPTSR